MIGRLREEFDADTHGSHGVPTRLRTDENTRLVTCGVCGDAYYVDDMTFGSIHRAISFDSGNPFACPRCQEEATDVER